MGRRRYFAAHRLEMLLDEDDSRSSSRVREHGRFLLVSQLHVAIQTLWSQCLSHRSEWTNRLVVHSHFSPCLFDLRLRFRLRLSLCLLVQRTQAHNSGWMVVHPQVSPFLSSRCLRDQTRHLFRTPEWTNLVVAHSRVSPFLIIWFFEFWLDWEFLLLPASSESNFFIQFSVKEIFGRGRSDA